ncbi:hypothetical protein BG000_000799 [Podila horticola]|nr:hypothetical protein BG000_000799 [Podila horticola]
MSTSSKLLHLHISMSSPPSLSSLPPEILHNILIDPRLRLHDLTICTRLCKSDNAVATPLIWRDLHLVFREKLQRFLIPEAQQAFRSNKDNAREFPVDLTDFDSLDAVFPLDKSSIGYRTAQCTNPMTLTIHDHWGQHPTQQLEAVQSVLLDLVARIQARPSSKCALPSYWRYSGRDSLHAKVTEDCCGCDSATLSSIKFLLENLPGLIKDVELCGPKLKKFHCLGIDCFLNKNVMAVLARLVIHMTAFEAKNLTEDIDTEDEEIA